MGFNPMGELLFGVVFGFVLGYGVRHMISSRRRRRARAKAASEREAAPAYDTQQLFRQMRGQV
jgi:hypothetical protein